MAIAAKFIVFGMALVVCLAFVTIVLAFAAAGERLVRWIA